MKKFQKVMCVLCLLIGTLTVYAQFAGGDGSAGNPYQVSTADQLNEVRNYPTSSFILNNDIDLTDYLTDPNPGYNAGAFWEPIGNASSAFAGNFNGNNYRVLALSINRPTNDNVGLFGFVSNGTISNLGVETDQSPFVNGNNNVGGLAGHLEYSQISGCYFKGSINAVANSIGGLIGWCDFSSSISNSYTNGEVHGAQTIGGLVGFVSHDSGINDSYSSSLVFGTESTAGLVGCVAYSGTYVYRSYSTGDVTGAGLYTGGFIGYTYMGAYLSDCYSTGHVLAGGTYNGGFIGMNHSSTLNNCYSTGEVAAGGTSGGFCGFAAYDSSITNCYWDKDNSGMDTSSGGEGKTTAEMKLESTFTGWNFDLTWIINPAVNDGYPILVNSFIDPVSFAGGDGTEGNPYQISTPEQLYYVRYSPEAYFILNNDIDLTEFLTNPNLGYNAGAFWRPIGTSTAPFKGNFNGNGYKITGLKIMSPNDDIGLFGRTDSSEIYDISIEIDPASSILGNNGTGGLVGYSSYDKFTNCYVSGQIAGKWMVGGIAGYTQFSVINNSFSNGSVNGQEFIGGLAGMAFNNTISNCYSFSSISGLTNIGGLLGYAESTGFINCYSAGIVYNIPGAGGLIGNKGTSSVENCYWDIESSGMTTSDGGEGKTTAEMKLESTFTGWNFDLTWIINPAVNDGYPFHPNSHIDPFTFAGGDGTSGNPFQIATAEHLNYVRYTPEAYYILNNEIDLTVFLTEPNLGYIEGAFWRPIGTSAFPFKGNFNGNNHKISGLKINRPAQDYVGLFGYTDNCEIFNLGVEIDPGSKILAKTIIGGLIGYCTNSIITDCSALGIIEGETDIGGLTGYIKESTLSDCFAKITIIGWAGIGGLAGGNQNSNVTKSYSKGIINGINSPIFLGGLIGMNEGSISNSYSTCTVNGGDYTGGLVGQNNLVTVSNCYALGVVSAGQYTGGLIGNNFGEVTNCYSIGSVTGSADIGGLIGTNSGSVTSSYWDNETSGQATSSGGEGKTTAEMQSIDTYSGWDFATTPIWVINGYLNGGYPYFNWDVRFHFGGGIGTPDNPFLIATPDHLNNVRNGLYAHYRQTANIDLGVSKWKDGEGWNPIGYYNSDTDYRPFTGIYDGNTFNITNLTINRPLSHSTGLFGYIYQSTITNFNLQGVNVVGGIEYTGALAGIVNNGNVFNSVSNGSVRGGNFTGGLIGYNTSGSTIENCSTYGSVSSVGEYTGGMVGYNYSESIINLCFASVVVNGALYAGGFAGMNSWYSVISNSCSIGPVSGIDGVGGFIGFEGYGSKAERCFALGDVASTGTNAGGFIALNYDTSEVNDSYCRGNVSGDINVGGFIGYNHTSALTNCYSTGTVSAVTGPVGGFAALTFESGITSSYWDTETSGQSASAGGIGKTTDDMTYLFGSDVYSGWNFDTIWVGSYNNNDAYPHLAWQGLTGIEEESNVPKVTELYQNYPNPFNPATEIKFALDRNSEVNLTVYNANGQLVKELVKDRLSAGYHKVSFDASGLNSGLYFYRLNYDNKAIARKMILVK